VISGFIDPRAYVIGIFSLPEHARQASKANTVISGFIYMEVYLGTKLGSGSHRISHPLLTNCCRNKLFVKEVLNL
jgi:hypothetical protein